MLDGQSQQITVVETDGSFVGTIGSPGEGPGELSAPMGFALTPDGEVAVFDIGHRGFVIYDREGEYLRSVPVDTNSAGGLPLVSVNAIATLMDESHKSALLLAISVPFSK